MESENNEMDAQGLAAKSTQEAHNQEYLPVKVLLHSTAHKVVAVSLYRSNSKQYHSYCGILEKREVQNLSNFSKFEDI